MPPRVRRAAFEPEQELQDKPAAKRRKSPAAGHEAGAVMQQQQQQQQDLIGKPKPKMRQAAAQQHGDKPATTKHKTTPAAKTAAAQQPDQQAGPRWYLVKSEPTEVSVEDMCAKPDQTEPWDGVRNGQARNILKQMQPGDQVFFYYSSCKQPGIVAICEVARSAYPDHTAWDPHSKYYDPSSSQDKPKWYMVDLKFKRKLQRFLSLHELKTRSDSLGIQDMPLFRRPRLSVQPVTAQQAETLLRIEQEQPEES